MSNDDNYHDHGEIDRSNGVFNPPHDWVDDLTTWTERGINKIAEENTSYRSGWHNTDNQLNRNK